VSGLLPALGGAGNVIQLAAGGLSGILAMSALIAGNVVAVNPGPAPVQGDLVVSSCMDRGPALGVAKPGEQLWVTGRSVDGLFLRVHVPGPIGEGWVPASHVTLLAGDPIPVTDCGDVASATGTPGPTAVPATATPTAGPTATGKPTAKPTASPTPAPTAKPTAKPAGPTQAAPPTATPTATPSPTPNLGPVFTMNPPRKSVTTVGTNPLGTGTCIYSQVVQITTAANDPDGIASIQLWVQRPGSTSYVRLSHDFTEKEPIWYNSISTANDKVVTDGTLFYRAVAIDTKGVSTTSLSGSLIVKRCDTEASISGGINVTPTNGIYYIYSCDSFTIPWRFFVSDPDGVSGVKMSYSLSHLNKTTLSGKITLGHLLRSLFWTGSATFPHSYYGKNTVTWTVTSTDPHTGTTSRRGSATVYFYTCVE
jgi:hypothetical protein